MRVFITAISLYLADDILGYASALLGDESLADRRDAIGRAHIEIAFLDEKTAEYLEEHKVIVPSLCAVVTLDENVVEEIHAESFVVLVGVVDRLDVGGVFA